MKTRKGQMFKGFAARIPADGKPKMLTLKPQHTPGPLEWNVDAIKSDGRDTGQVQIWADVDKQDAFWIKNAVANFELFREVARQAIYDHPDCECEAISAKCLHCFASEAVAKAEGR